MALELSKIEKIPKSLVPQRSVASPLFLDVNTEFLVCQGIRIASVFIILL